LINPLINLEHLATSGDKAAMATFVAWQATE
jgi:hypothetical protein